VQSAISATNLEIRFGDVVALSGVSLTVPAGTSLAVIGSNGSGKSTFLGALAGLHKSPHGMVEIAATPALVLQSTEVEAGLPITVHDAVKLDLAREPMQNLSGGQRQRVLMAQGLAQHSPILLLDEPMTGLDITTRQIVLDVIAEEVASGGTVVMTTHSLADANECDLALLLDTKARTCAARSATASCRSATRQLSMIIMPTNTQWRPRRTRLIRQLASAL